MDGSIQVWFDSPSLKVEFELAKEKQKEPFFSLLCMYVCMYVLYISPFPSLSLFSFAYDYCCTPTSSLHHYCRDHGQVTWQTKLQTVNESDARRELYPSLSLSLTRFPFLFLSQSICHAGWRFCSRRRYNVPLPLFSGGSKREEIFFLAADAAGKVGEGRGTRRKEREHMFRPTSGFLILYETHQREERERRAWRNRSGAARGKERKREENIHNPHKTYILYPIVFNVQFWKLELETTTFFVEVEPKANPTV